MKHKEEKYDLIDKYLLGELTHEEQNKFDHLMETDSEFKEELKLHREVKEALIERKVQEFSSNAKHYIGNPTKINKGSRHKFSKYWWIVMILILISLAFYKFKDRLIKPTPVELFHKYAAAPEEFYLTKDYSITRDAQVEQSNDQDKLDRFLEDLYRQKDYQQLIQFLTDQGERFWPEPSEYHFQLGVLYLLRDYNELAIYHLRKGSNSRPEATHWYKGLAFLKTSQLDSVAVELLPLTKYKNPYQEMAVDILRRVE